MSSALDCSVPEEEGLDAPALLAALRAERAECERLRADIKRTEELLRSVINSLEHHPKCIKRLSLGRNDCTCHIGKASHE